MQDIDFDELDRAVNSVSNPTPPSIPDTPSVSVPVSQPKPTVSSTPAARRSSGRFMDVVHPSSDMRGASVPERSAPRDVPVKPTFEETLAPKSVPSATPTFSEPSKPAPVASADWPDPLDFQGFSLEETPRTPKPEPAPVVEESQEEAPAQPLESPFLSDAKVEKRPLGAFSANDEPDELPLIEEPEETPLLDAPDEVELLEAENYTPPAVEVTEEKTPEPTPAPAPIVEEHQGPTSITQQYKEQPSTADQPSGAIYDTEAYHQPLIHAPRKKSGALVIVWIAALILVGAGAGAAVYFFVLPML